MKVSLNWLKEYISIDLPPEKIGEILTNIGLEVEGMEEVESIKGGLRGIIVGKVKTCEKHPNADRLSLTKVDIGNGDPLQIVCGAPNVAAGQKVLVATVGTTLYDKEGNGFVIKKGKLRGEISEGMICAEDELGLGNDHSGILVLPDEVPVGTLASDYYKIESDIVYEIGLTPNRSDATSHIGVAKDLAAYLRINHGDNKGLAMPDVNGFQVDQPGRPIDVVVDLPEAAPRYAGLVISGIRVKSSPEWLQNRLRAIGVRPINNIVDVTNFVLHELGQPLHAFDAAKIKHKKILVRTLSDGTIFNTLDGMERRLSDHDLMICDGASHGMCIAGVFGGVGSGVTEKTKEIFLESAHFNSKWVRRTSMKYNLRTDAAKVFEKGSDPNMPVYALKRAALMIQELAGGKVTSDVIDLYPNPIKPVQIRLRYASLNRLIGIEIPPKEVIAIVEAMDMKVVDESGEYLLIEVPTNKSDVLREADLIEEILRIYGLNKVPIPSHIKSSLVFSDPVSPEKLKNIVADLLAARGFQEMMALSLSQSRYYKDVLPVDAESLVYVNNTSNIHLDIMRPDLLFSALEAVVHNQNRQQADVKLFEFGKAYRQNGKHFHEPNHLTITMSGNRYQESWIHGAAGEVNFYYLKAMVHLVLDRLGINGFQQTRLQDEIFDYSLSYHRGDNDLVQFGAVRQEILKKLSIKRNVMFADFNWDNILATARKDGLLFEEFTKFPSTRRDLALVVKKTVTFREIETIARNTEKKLLKDVNLFDVYENEEQLGKGKKSYAVSFVFEAAEKTLEDKEVDKIMNRLIRKFEEQLEAVIRK